MRFFVADGPEDGDAWQEGVEGVRHKEGWHESVPLIAPTGGGSRRNPAHSRGRSKLQPTELGAISAV